jgi:hypothetical protein
MLRPLLCSIGTLVPLAALLLGCGKREQNPAAAGSILTARTFFDANGDGLPDLYVASCGYRLAPVSRLLQDRLYINQGGGRFVRDTQALPAMPTCTASVAAGDFTGDG